MNNTPLNYRVACYTILRKEVKRFIRLWSQTLVPPVMTVALYFLIFGHVLGNVIGNINNYSYVQFIAPGLIMMSVINSAYANVSSSFYLLRFGKSIEELLVSPIPNYLILICFTLAGSLRGLLVGILVTIVALFFTHLHIFNIVVIFSVLILSAVLFSLAGFTNGIYARNFDDIAFVPTFILTPLNYLGGIFYSIHLLSGFWYKLSLFNPILYMVNAFRYGILGISDVSPSIAFTILITCCVSLFLWNLHLLNKGVGIKT